MWTDVGGAVECFGKECGLVVCWKIRDVQLEVRDDPEGADTSEECASVRAGVADGSPGFSVTSSCPDGTYPVTCGPVTVTVTSLNGFSGTVTLSTTVNPSCGYNCLTATMNPSSVSVSSGGSNTSKLQLSYTCHRDLYHPNCESDVTITGTSGNLTSNTSVFVCIGRLCPIAGLCHGAPSNSLFSLIRTWTKRHSKPPARLRT